MPPHKIYPACTISQVLGVTIIQRRANPSELMECQTTNLNYLLLHIKTHCSESRGQ